MNNKLSRKDNFVIYTTEDNNINVEAFIENENLWMNQEQISQLFEKAKSTINEHIKNIYAEKELSEESTFRKFGNTELSTKPTNYYNLDMIIAIGYRVKSTRGTQFRIWANNILKNYLIKGYNLNVKRFKNNGGGVYFDEILAQIRDIRSSEKVFWRKELDSFLTLTHNDILSHKGKISHKQALNKAHKEYDKYMRTHLTQAEKDYLEIMGEDIKKLK